MIVGGVTAGGITVGDITVGGVTVGDVTVRGNNRASDGDGEGFEIHGLP